MSILENISGEMMAQAVLQDKLAEGLEPYHWVSTGRYRLTSRPAKDALGKFPRLVTELVLQEQYRGTYYDCFPKVDKFEWRDCPMVHLDVDGKEIPSAG